MDPPEGRIKLDILEQMTRPSERSADSSPGFLDLMDDPTDEVSDRRSIDGTDTPASVAARPPGDTTSPEARTDPITGLANLPLLIDRLDKALMRRRGSDGPVLAIHIELNNFRYVQDQLGEGAANAILKEISHRLLSLLRNEDTVARAGTSKLIVAVSLHDEAATALLTERLQAAFEDPMVLPDREVRVWASFASVEAQSSESAAEVLDRLDTTIRLERPGASTAWSSSLDGRGLRI